MSMDVHRDTVYHDELFHRWMDAVNPGWRNWNFRRVRLYAKTWNFSRLYGTRNTHPRLFNNPPSPINDHG